MSITGQNSAINIWGLIVRRVGYMALGAVLFGIVSYTTNILQLSDIGNISFRPATAILLFFGAVFGPWVGLFTGCVGTFIGEYISGYGVFWNWDLGNALIGFIVGCSIYLTLGRFDSSRNIKIAEVFSAIGIVVGISFAAFSDIWVAKYPISLALTDFISATLSYLINGLILLPIMIVAYKAIRRRTGQA